MKSYRIRKDRLIKLIVLLYFVIGTIVSSYGYRQNPEDFAQGVKEGIVFWFEK